MEFLLFPPVAFLIYIPLVIIFLLFGRALTGPHETNPVKTSTYGSGESGPTKAAAPGYRPFFLVAFFFAILHLGILILGSSYLTPISGLYVLGLILALIALLLG